MILGFKEQFVQKIIDGSKIHTIREDKHDRWKPGRRIDFATGVRTKKYNQFTGGVCISIQSFWFLSPAIEYSDDSICEFGPHIYIDGMWIVDFKKLIRLAKNDGFDSVRDFKKFFPVGFMGKIIHWTDFRY